MAKSSKEKTIETIMEIIRNNNDDMKTGISWRNEIFSGSIHRIFIDDNGSLKFEGPLYKRRHIGHTIMNDLIDDCYIIEPSEIPLEQLIEFSIYLQN
jgi:hypothetical protein